MRKLLLLTIVLPILNSCGVDFSKKETLQDDVHAVVMKKYIDHGNHGAPTIYYKTGNDTIRYHVIDWAKKSDFWEFLDEGDSVIKPSGKLIMRVKKPDGTYKDFQYRP